MIAKKHSYKGMMNDADIEKRLIEIGFNGKRLQLHLRIWNEFRHNRKGKLSIEVVENYLTGNNTITKSVIRYIFKIIQPEQEAEQIKVFGAQKKRLNKKAFAEQQDTSKPQAKEIKVFGAKKKRLDKKAFAALRIEIGESAMERAKVNKVSQKIEEHINFDKYAPIINSPCIGCIDLCNPENCNALTNFVIGI